MVITEISHYLRACGHRRQEINLLAFYALRGRIARAQGACTFRSLTWRNFLQRLLTERKRAIFAFHLKGFLGAERREINVRWDRGLLAHAALIIHASCCGVLIIPASRQQCRDEMRELLLTLILPLMMFKVNCAALCT